MHYQQYKEILMFYQHFFLEAFNATDAAIFSAKRLLFLASHFTAFLEGVCVSASNAKPMSTIYKFSMTSFGKLLSKARFASNTKSHGYVLYMFKEFLIFF